MMLLVSNMVYDIIKEFDDLNNYFDNDIYPLAAPIDASLPIAVYNVNKSAIISKELIQDITVQIILVGKSYEQMCIISDQMETHFLDHQDFEYRGTNAGVNPDDPSEININITYNLKMF